jgi:hypothetical protein
LTTVFAMSANNLMLINCRQLGFPYRKGEIDREATFSCKHKYTGRPICAEPCNGIGGMCEKDLDEECQVWSFRRGLLSVFGTIFLMMLIIEVVLFIMREQMATTGSGTATKQKDPMPDRLSLLKSEIDGVPLKYADIRQNEEFGNALMNLVLYNNYCDDIQATEDLCRKYYEQEKIFQGGNVNKADTFYLDTMGTNMVTSLFYDYVYGSLIISLRRLLAPFFTRDTVVRVKSALAYRKIIVMAKFCISTFFHYLDLVKDTLLVVQMLAVAIVISEGTVTIGHNKNTTVTFAVLFFVTIAISELFNILLILNRKDFKSIGKDRCLSIFVIPAARAFFRYREAQMDLKMTETLAFMRTGKISMAEGEGRLIRYTERFTDLRTLRLDFRSSDNVLEHFPQLTILAVLFILEHQSVADSRYAPLANIFLDTNSYFIWFSTSSSFLSVVIGHLHYMKVRNRGYSVMVGLPVQVTYYVVCCLARVILVLFCFTLLLGLFSTHQHGYTGYLGTTRHDRGKAIFDFAENGTSENFTNAWKPVMMVEATELFETTGNIIVVVFILVGIIIFHFWASFAISWNIIDKVDGTLYRVTSNLYTFICPPLFFDWQEFYLRDKSRYPFVKGFFWSGQPWYFFQIRAGMLGLVEEALP